MNMKTTKLTVEEHLIKADKFYQESNFNEVLHHCRQALIISPGYAPIFKKVGKVHFVMQDYEKALHYYHIYLKKSLLERKPEDIANAYLAIAGVYEAKKDYDAAITYTGVSRGIFEERKDYLNLSKSYNNLGVLYRKQSQYEKSIQYYKKALNISINHNDLEKMSYYYFNIAILYKEQKHFFKAWRYMKKYLKLDKMLHTKKK